MSLEKKERRKRGRFSFWFYLKIEPPPLYSHLNRERVVVEEIC